MYGYITYTSLLSTQFCCWDYIYKRILQKPVIGQTASAHFLNLTLMKESLPTKGSSMRVNICLESFVLSIICMADMLSTLFLVSMGIAVEHNPLMAACLRHSTVTFVFIKTASFVPFIIITEMYRRKNPTFARASLRIAIFLYISIYVILTARTCIVWNPISDILNHHYLCWDWKL